MEQCRDENVQVEEDGLQPVHTNLCRFCHLASRLTVARQLLLQGQAALAAEKSV
jgi:hypothetical protein